MNIKKTILAIETSCDETAVAIVSFVKRDNGVDYKVLAHALYSQAEKHAVYGGVYPSLAKREHQKNIIPLLKIALKEAGIEMEKKKVLSQEEKDSVEDMCGQDETLKDVLLQMLEYERPKILDYIAVTRGPGLAPALWVGVNAARSLAFVWDIPLIGINHMIGHIVIGFANGENIPVVETPILAVLVSGGHTEFVFKKKSGDNYEKIGETLDDALGESFDKVARMLGLGYPGGPRISEYATRSRIRGKTDLIPFPRPLTQKDTLNFSYSGLKTAVRRVVESYEKLEEHTKEDIAREFEDAAIETVLKKTQYAIETHKPKTFVLGGGVAANTLLREGLTNMQKIYPDIAFYIPDCALTTDNAVMIALSAWFERGNLSDPLTLSANAKESL